MGISHFQLMLVYAFLLSAYFALLWRRDRKQQLKLFGQIFLGLVLGGLAVAWAMYPFPSGPPVPFP